MRVRDIQHSLDLHWPGAWNVQRSPAGFTAVRIDSVDAITIADLTALAAWAKKGDMLAYVTTEPRSKLPEDGVWLAVWLAPIEIRARKIRKLDRRSSERRGGPRRVSDAARRRLRR